LLKALKEANSTLEGAKSKLPLDAVTGFKDSIDGINKSVKAFFTSYDKYDIYRWVAARVHCKLSQAFYAFF